MKPFAERNPIIIGTTGAMAVIAITVTALNYQKLPFINGNHEYSAFFNEAGGLRVGAPVQVSGVEAGKVTGIRLDGPRVLVTFDVNDAIHLGDRTEAAVKTKSLLGSKELDVVSYGEGQLAQTIPLESTTSAYQLPDALGDLSSTIRDLDTDQASASLATLAETFRDTPPDLQVAVEQVARFSKTLNQRDTQLRSLLTDANKVTAVLAERTDQIVSLINNTNSLLAGLHSQSTALDHIARNVSAAAEQLSGFIADNRSTLRPALDKLNGVLAMVDNRKERVQKALNLATGYVMKLGETVASGPFFKAYVANLLPGQFLQPFIEAAFSDLGLDPHVLLPSQRTDPPTGQPGTPALPVPYPRTGQGGEPDLTLPDAITGNPGDPRYPYREPLPAPPPGGPPPGPPAAAPPGMASTPDPTPRPVFQPAPGEVLQPGAPPGGNAS
jgi:phospholipid/cholesterol/gamma-HCH transport system substrate-binding protein